MHLGHGPENVRQKMMRFEMTYGLWVFNTVGRGGGGGGGVVVVVVVNRNVLHSRSVHGLAAGT